MDIEGGIVDFCIDWAGSGVGDQTGGGEGEGVTEGGMAVVGDGLTWGVGMRVRGSGLGVEGGAVGMGKEPSTRPQASNTKLKPSVIASWTKSRRLPVQVDKRGRGFLPHTCVFLIQIFPPLRPFALWATTTRSPLSSEVKGVRRKLP